jgi:DNA-directed RNA polymerase subunit H (RpoH/RPB5)
MEKTNFLVPKHQKISSEEVKRLLEKHGLESVDKLPKIKARDPALASLNIEIGDVIEITRHSFVGETKYYRVVVE